MKLYYSPAACSLSPHIVLNELGLKYEAEKVDLKSKRTASGKDFKEISPKGYVPSLEIENGQLLTEGPAIIQYLADRKPESQLAPAWGTMERYRLMEMLNFLSTEIHKTFSPLFNSQTPDTVKAAQIDKLKQRFDELSKTVEKQEYVMGAQFTVADAYLFTLLGWTKFVGMDLNQWPVLAKYSQRIAARPAVQAAMKAEGLV